MLKRRFTRGGFDPDGAGPQLQPGSAETVYFPVGGSVTFSDFGRITRGA